jgi:small-conductance mechanosensitive channel
LLLKKIAVLARFAVYAVVAAGVGSSLLDLSNEAVLAISGTFGLALGFALKDVAASLMAGVMLLIDQPFQVGDRISFDGYYGEVTKIGLRSVRLVTLDDNHVTIPNSRFQESPVASANAGELDCMVVIPFYISAGEDFVRARRLIAEATATSRYVYLDKPMVTLVSDEFLGERFVTIVRVKAYVLDARFEKAFASDVTTQVKLALREANILTPDSTPRHLDLPPGGSEQVEALLS